MLLNIKSTAQCSKGHRPMHRSLRSNTALLSSERTRQALADEAVRRGHTYRFTGAGGADRTWLKGQYAYLGPNALSSVLLRWEITHDVIADEELLTDLDAYSALFVPGADRFTEEEIARIAEWRAGPDRFLVVTGRTNLPLDLLGLSSLEPAEPAGYTAWSWTEASPFGDRARWSGLTVSGAPGYACAVAEAAPGAMVLAELVELSGDLASAETATRTRIGDGIVAAGKTFYIANQPFEFLGGVLQAHLNVEAIRGWDLPTHWGDALAFRLRESLREMPAKSLWNGTLRPFGTYDGVLQLRHDVDHTADQALDFSMLDAELDAAAPASYYVMDPEYCRTRCTVMGGKMWTEALSRSNLFETAQHNDSVEGDPPRAIVGTGLADHIAASDLTMGTASRTAGRHMGFLVYPETIDAMAYLYDSRPGILGLCTFSLYDVIEYGVRNPEVVLHGKEITYTTYDHAHPERPAAISGYWFPYHAVVSTVEEHRALRGWDVTHDTDCNFDRLETLFDGLVGANPGVPGSLENGVFTIQYESQLAQAPFENGGHGHLPWLRYAIAYAERKNFWITTKLRLYERMNDYQDVVLRREADGGWTLHNPTGRVIEGLALRPGPDTALAANGRTLIHIAAGVTLLPVLEPGETTRLTAAPGTEGPRIRQPNSRFVELLEAWHDPACGTLFARGRLIRTGQLVIEGLATDTLFVVKTSDNRGSIRQRLQSTANGALAVPLFGQRENIGPFTVAFETDSGRTL
jgi:hypothetical protein